MLFLEATYHLNLFLSQIGIPRIPWLNNSDDDHICIAEAINLKICIMHQVMRKFYTAFGLSTFFSPLLFFCMLSSSQRDHQHQPFDTIYQEVFESGLPRQVPDHEPLLIDALNTERFLTFQDLKNNVRAVASAFRGPSLQLKEGDIVAICSENDVELVTAIHGTMAAGCTALMLPVILSDDEVEAIFTVAPPKLLIVHAKILHRFKTTEGGFKSFLGLPTLVIGVGGPQSVYRHLSEYYTFHSPSDLPAVHPDTSAFFVCTSGSTGPRKLIDITNRIGAFRMHDMFLYLEHSAITPNSIVLSSSSFSFVFSMMVYVQLYVQYGVRQYVLPSDDLDAILEAIHQHRVTLTSLISPKHVATIAERPGVTKNYDLACLKTVRSGGQMLAEATVLAASRILGVDIENPFGTSEVSVVFQSDKSGCRFLSFDGKIRLHDDRFVVKLIDDEGQPVPKGQLGELCVKSPAVARGYFNNPIKTAEAFDDDGFYHTGDIFFLNDDGNYVIQGRKSDIIKTAKKYCSPVPIVDICMSFGGISQCAVVGAYDAKVASEFPRAYIVPHNLDAFPPSRLEEFIQYVNERVPDKAMMLTGGANILPMLPYTASNKLDMFKLRGLAQKELEEMTGP